MFYRWGNNMKNLKVNKKFLIVATVLGMSLVSGCDKKETEEIPIEEAVEDIHLITYNTDGGAIIFRECEGYDVRGNYKSGIFYYNIYYNNESILSGATSSCQVSLHEYIQELEQRAIEKGAYVYKLNK